MIVKNSKSFSNTQCNICGCSKFRLLYIKNGYDIIRCSQCELIYVKNIPSPEILQNVYTEAYYRASKDSIGKLDYIAQKERLVAIEKERLHKIEKHIGCNKKGTWLDVGCGLGFLLDQARQAGWETSGLEFSEYGAYYAQHELNLNVIVGDFLEVDYPEEYYDIITMYGLLEHLPDPSAGLNKVYRLLKSNGLLIVEVPIMDCFISRIMGSRGRHITPPQHLYYFSRKTLTTILEKAGFGLPHLENGMKVFLSVDKLMRLIEHFSLSNQVGQRISRPLSIMVDKLQIRNYGYYISFNDVCIAYAKK